MVTLVAWVVQSSTQAQVDLSGLEGLDLGLWTRARTSAGEEKPSEENPQPSAPCGPVAAHPSATLFQLVPVQTVNQRSHGVVMTTCLTVRAPRSADRHTGREEEECFSFPSAASSHMTPLHVCVSVCVCVCVSVSVCVRICVCVSCAHSCCELSQQQLTLVSLGAGINTHTQCSSSFFHVFLSCVFV